MDPIQEHPVLAHGQIRLFPYCPVQKAILTLDLYRLDNVISIPHA